MEKSEINIGDIVLTSAYASGWGSGSEVCSKELLVIDIKDEGIPTNPRIYFEPKRADGNKYRTRLCEVVRIVQKKGEIINIYPLY